MKLIAKFIYYIIGWKIEGKKPDYKKYLLIVAPHTSNLDFFIGLTSRFIIGFKPNYLGKKELFKFPFGYFFRAVGGYPVDRSKNNKLVPQVIEIFNENEEFVMTVTPEGTRSLAKRWRTGFYHIALGANVPIVLVSFDYAKKILKLDEPHFVDPDKETEMNRIYKFFEGVTAKNPEKFFLPPYS